MAFGRKRPPPGRGQRKTTQPLTQPPVTVAKAILQSPRRSYNRLGDPTNASVIPQSPRRSTVAEAIVGKTRILLAPCKPSRRKHAPIGITMRQNCGLSKEPFYPQSCTKRFRPPFAKGGGSEEQSPRRQRRRTKERAQRSAGRGGIPNARMNTALYAPCFLPACCPTVCGFAVRQSRGIAFPRGRTAFAAESAAKAVQFRPTGTRPCTVGFDSADSSALSSAVVR